ncbi:MAG TPA: DNA mismatch repair endonuclease MutL [Candidatus Acidoferrales bacterium]
MSRIRILPEAVANKIAAGEVVERPASVVKELLENAIDAGARSIRIEVEAGGKRLIRVVDDGCGMSADDALLSFERHATSKLRTPDDLLSIATLGFRGEALPTIAAVSRLVLETRERTDVGATFSPPAEGEALRPPAADAGQASPAPTAEGDTATMEAAAEDAGLKPSATQESDDGMRIEFAGGKLISVKPAGVPPGTSVSVADLFYSVPARRKFLKSETTELGHIASLVTHYALAHPDRQFILKTPSQEIVHTSPVERLADRVYQLFGRAALDELLEIPAAAAPVRAAIHEPELEDAERGAEMRVSGFTSRPEVQRPNRNGIYVFVNRRLVRDRLILHAVHEAYRNVIPPHVFPAVLLFLELPYEEVDVNVHPAKIEVRFRHANFVHDFARDAIRHALAQARPIASFAVAAGAAPSRGLGMSGDAAPGAHSAAAGAAAGAPGPFAPPPAVIPPAFSPGAGGFELSGAPDRPLPQRFGFEAAPAMEFAAAAAAAMSPLAGPLSDAEHSAAPVVAIGAGPHPASEGIADLKPLGQVSASFIVAVSGDALWVIDQHVAHERILFEQHLAARRRGHLTGQRLLMPIVVELGPRQLVIYERIAEELTANGFEVEPIGPRSVAIQAVPAGVSTGDAEKLLTEILDGVENESKAVSMESVQAKIAASTACRAAIKINNPLDHTKMEWLLAELAKTEYPMSCPHGRPVLLRYSLRDLEKAFQRI